MAELRVLIVDDEPLVREGIRVFLDREVNVRVLGEARNGEEAVEHIRATLSVSAPAPPHFAREFRDSPHFSG